MDFLFIYVFIGIIVDFVIYQELENEGITGEHILSLLPPDKSIWLREHPNAYKVLLLLAFCVVIFIWPYVLYRIWNSYEE